MKFPVPKTLTGAGSPMILLNWIFGFGVIQYPMGKPRPKISAFWSIGNFLGYLSFVVMANFPGITEIKGSKIAANNYRMNAYSCVTFIAIGMFLAYFRAKVIRRTFTKLIDMNGRLKILGIPNDHELVFKIQIIQLCVAFTSIFIIVVLDFEYVDFQFPSEMSRFGFLMTFHYFLILGSVMDCSFSTSIRYFGNRFQRLNALLVESDLLESNETTVTPSDNQFPRRSSMIREIDGDVSSSFRAANKQWPLYVLREIRKIHRGLCKTATELNRAFGVQVLLSVALSVTLITMLLYTSYILATESSFNSSSLDNWMAKSLTLIWITYYCMKVISVIYACETTSYEANRTGGLISKLLDTAPCDEDIHDEVLRGVSYANLISVQRSTISINTFSLQLLQNPLKFTANGFFTLNYSLVHAIIGSVTTYLVIMIQMRSIYDATNLNATLNSTP